MIHDVFDRRTKPTVILAEVTTPAPRLILAAKTDREQTRFVKFGIIQTDS
jgi:hypothetical protein